MKPSKSRSYSVNNQTSKNMADQCASIIDCLLSYDINSISPYDKIQSNHKINQIKDSNLKNKLKQFNNQYFNKLYQLKQFSLESFENLAYQHLEISQKNLMLNNTLNNYKIQVEGLNKQKEQLAIILDNISSRKKATEQQYEKLLEKHQNLKLFNTKLTYQIYQGQENIKKKQQLIHHLTQQLEKSYSFNETLTKVMNFMEKQVRQIQQNQLKNKEINSRTDFKGKKNIQLLKNQIQLLNYENKELSKQIKQQQNLRLINQQLKALNQQLNRTINKMQIAITQKDTQIKQLDNTLQQISKNDQNLQYYLTRKQRVGCIENASTIKERNKNIKQNHEQQINNLNHQADILMNYYERELLHFNQAKKQI